MLRRLISTPKVHSDFLSTIARDPDQVIVFIDVGCRGEPILNWPLSRTDLFYYGVDANGAEIDRLLKELDTYKGEIKAKFIAGLVSNDTGNLLYFATSPVGMTDTLVDFSEIEHFESKGWSITSKAPISLDDIMLQVAKEVPPNSKYILKIDVEGHAGKVIEGQKSLELFDTIICEFLPEKPAQFAAMSILENKGFRLVDIERAYKYDPELGRGLFIIDTLWKLKTEDTRDVVTHNYCPNVFQKLLSFTVFYAVRLLMSVLRKKTYISISDSELKW